MNNPFQDDPQELRRFIVESGALPREENERIFEEWFRHAPRYLFRAVDRKYGLTRRRLCDLGCAYGTNLVYATSDSYGIEIDDRMVAFCHSLGLTVYQLDFAHEDVRNLPRVEAVWCSAVLEHVDAPHVFLRKIHSLLIPGGLAVIYVPTIPSIRWLRPHRWPLLGQYFRRHMASDHVNAFVPETLAFFCERAGFETLEVSPFFPGALRVFNHWPVVPRMMDGCVYVGRAIPDWNYATKATRRVAENTRGFIRVDVGAFVSVDPLPEAH